jgi:hypothetical protein
MEACRDERVRVILQKLYKFELCLSTSIYGGLCKIDEEEGGVVSRFSMRSLDQTFSPSGKFK